VKEPNSFENSEFLEDLEFISEQVSTADLSQHQGESQAASNATKLEDPLSGHGGGKEARLNQVVEQACLATGATGAAIALVRGEEIVCHASTGPHAPEIGTCLDPHKGLSGSCIQTRQLQQCNDTETDPRVDPDACRSLGVRSIVVLPLIDGDEFFGVFEILSSRANVFGQRDLNILLALTDRIVESRKQNWQATAATPSKEPGSLLPKLEEVVPKDRSHPSETASVFPRRERMSRRNATKTTVVNVLVIASAVLLGTLVGWRLGWQKATVGFHASSSRYRSIAPSKNERSEHAVSPGKELQTSPAWTDECGQSGAADFPAPPPSGGLTVCQGGRVIFRLPPSAPLPIRDSQTAQRTRGLEAGPPGR